MGDLQSDAAEHLYVAVDGEASKRVPGVGEEVVEPGAVLVGGAQLKEQHRMILADGELDEGWFLIFANVVGVLHINSDDLVALEFEVSLVLLDDGGRLVQLVGVDHLQLGVAVGLHLEFLGESHGLEQFVLLQPGISWGTVSGSAMAISVVCGRQVRSGSLNLRAGKRQRSARSHCRCGCAHRGFWIVVSSP